MYLFTCCLYVQRSLDVIKLFSCRRLICYQKHITRYQWLSLLQMGLLTMRDIYVIQLRVVLLIWSLYVHAYIPLELVSNELSFLSWICFWTKGAFSNNYTNISILIVIECIVPLCLLYVQLFPVSIEKNTRKIFHQGLLWLGYLGEGDQVWLPHILYNA